MDILVRAHPYNGLVLRISQFKLTINHDYTKFTLYGKTWK